MHDGVIRVKQVVTEPGNRDVPIRFAELSAVEKIILRTVTEDDGYSKCDVSDAFVRFIE